MSKFQIGQVARFTQSQVSCLPTCKQGDRARVREVLQEEKGRPTRKVIQTSFPSLMALSTVRNSLRKYASEKRWQGKSKLVLGDQYSRVTLDSDESFRELRKRFSFLHPSFWFMRGRFGGSGARSRFATQTHFITEKGRFPTGLLEDVTHNVRFRSSFFMIASLHRSVVLYNRSFHTSIGFFYNLAWTPNMKMDFKATITETIVESLFREFHCAGRC